MRMRFIHSLLIVLLGASSLFAHAGDGDHREQGRSNASNGGNGGNGADGAYPGARDEGREQRQAARQERQRDVRAVQQTPPPEQHGEGQQDRRGNRMSPEDRRALRRQIDQASHDIYAPNR